MLGVEAVAPFKPYLWNAADQEIRKRRGKKKRQSGVKRVNRKRAGGLSQRCHKKIEKYGIHSAQLKKRGEGVLRPSECERVGSAVGQ